MSRKNENRFSLYLNELNLQRIHLLKSLMYKKFKIDISVSKIIDRCINEKKCIDDMIVEIMQGEETTVKEK